MTLAEQALWNVINSTPITAAGADDGIILTLLLVAFLIIVFKPDFSRI